MLQLLLLFVISCTSSYTVLRPEIRIDNEVIYPGEPKVYELKGLDPMGQYEVRISYPATTPTIFTLRVLHGEKKRVLRRRLNTEKIVVSGKDESMLVQVEAKPEGVSPVIELSKRPTKFNIVLEQLIWGIPTSAFRLILMAGVLLVLGISYGLPLLQNFLVSIQTETFKDT